jgi:hypothetical protein
VGFFVGDSFGDRDFEDAVFESGLDLVMSESLRNGDHSTERAERSLGDLTKHFKVSLPSSWGEEGGVVEGGKWKGETYSDASLRVFARGFGLSGDRKTAVLEIDRDILCNDIQKYTRSA